MAVFRWRTRLLNLMIAGLAASLESSGASACPAIRHDSKAHSAVRRARPISPSQHDYRRRESGSSGRDSLGPAPRKEIVIDVRRRKLYAFVGSRLAHAFNCVTGKRGWETEAGHFKVYEKCEDYVSRAYEIPMPYALFFSADRKAIHQTSIAEFRSYFQTKGFDVGSHGCVGLSETDAKTLYKWTDLGTSVEVWDGHSNLGGQWVLASTGDRVSFSRVSKQSHRFALRGITWTIAEDRGRFTGARTLRGTDLRAVAPVMFAALEQLTLPLAVLSIELVPIGVDRNKIVIELALTGFDRYGIIKATGRYVLISGWLTKRKLAPA